MSEYVETHCDGCDGIPGHDIDSVLFYHPCEHAVCYQCSRKDNTGLCSVCGVGVDAYHRSDA